jgi:hypothetical protein
MVSFLFVLACRGLEENTQTGPEAMAPLPLLIRASIDLRGVRPSAEELAAVEADSSKVEDYIAQYMEDPRFEGRVSDLYQQIFLTRNDAYLISAASYGLPDEATFAASVGDEVPRIVGRIAAEDRPWTELVTGDWTMANETLATVWPIDYQGPGWQPAKYTDGRPAVGILTTNSLWWRYTSTDSNANRKRANAISRTLLCSDYLSRPIEFDRNLNLLDEGAVTDALRTDPACISCHNTLDPIASSLFGFWWYDYTNPREARSYFPEREQRWKDYGNVAPGWYGQPVHSLRDLGQKIAGDSRFVDCAVEQAWELLLRRDRDIADDQTLVTHRNAFLSGGLSLKPLFRSVMADPMYRAADSADEAYSSRKQVTPELLGSMVQDLTGFAWTYGGYDMLRTDASGFLTLAGGADGYAVTEPADSPNTTLVLVQERLAENAAWYVVNQDPSRLFTVDFTETPETGKAAMVAQLQALHWRIFGTRVAAEGAEVEAGLALWSDLYAVEPDGKEAWAGVLSILLRDPDFLFY